MRGKRTCTLVPASLFLLSSASFGQPQAPVREARRITQAINDDDRVSLAGDRHPLAMPENEAGAAPADLRFDRMILTLLPDAGQKTALEQLLADQQNPQSPQYHQWLTPEAFGLQYGVSQADLDQVADWLRSHGFAIVEIPAGRLCIVFSGTVSQVESAFQTSIRTYHVNGETHYANAADPEIPRALAPVVHGVVSLNDFRSSPLHTGLRSLAMPEFASGNGQSYLAPADFATIYDLGPLTKNAITGTGQSIAIAGRSNLNLTDVQTFRSYFGLPANNPTIIVNATDPGIVSTDEETEAVLDVEWAGAVAQNAAIKFVVSASTSSTDGVDLSAAYIVNQKLAPVMSVSFGVCEAAAGSSGNAFINNLWQQAAAEGITVFVAAGDSGAAGCDAPTSPAATHGAAVNALCSTPYDVCVGGTEFNEGSNPSFYWSSQSNPATKSSALEYIPEMVWNESALDGHSGLWAGGGGASTVYAKPAWQNVSGVPADGARDVPDVALSAAGHDGYLIYMNGGLAVVSGTSAASPSFAGLMALVDENTGGAHGAANATLYGLAGQQFTGGTAVFHDIETGNNSVPGVTGFNAGAGYDLASGLGSVDAAALVNNWGGATSTPAPPSLSLSLQMTAVQLVQGSNGAVAITVRPAGNFNSAVSLSLGTLPSGVSATLAPSVFSAPGAGVSELNLTASSLTAPGTYSIPISATGGGLSQQASVSLTVAAAPVPADFALALSPQSVTTRGGTSTRALVTLSALGRFNSAIALSVAGLTRGMTASFAPGTVSANGTSTLTLNVGLLVPPGTYSIQVTAAGGGKTHTQTLRVTVTLAVVGADLEAPATIIATSAFGAQCVVRKEFA